MDSTRLYENEGETELFSMYSSLGWRIFPVHSVRHDGVCTCGDKECANPGKHPRIKNWTSLASADPVQIQKWRKQFPHSNFGLVCGEGSGVVVIDVDPRHGGDDSLVDLGRDVGGLPETVTNLTGSGGQHFLFAYPKGHALRNAVNLKGKYAGLDVRAENGFIVIPPSRHVSGRNYEWDIEHAPGEFPLATLPDALLELLSDAERIRKPITPEEWVSFPSEIARQLPELCPWLAEAIGSRADDVTYDQWVGIASWAHGVQSEDSSLFHEWSQHYSRYHYSDTEKKWADTAGIAPYSCERMDGNEECKGCTILGRVSNPVVALRKQYGKALGLSKPFGAPPADVPSPEQANLHLAVDNTDRIRQIRTELEEAIEKIRAGEDPLEVVENHLNELTEFYQLQPGKAQFYAYALVEANKGKVLTKTILMEMITERADPKKGNQSPGATEMDLSRGLRYEIAVTWAKLKSRHFVYESEQGLRLQESRLAKELVKDFHIHYAFGGLYAYNGRFYEPTDDRLAGFILEVLEATGPTWGKASTVESVLKTLIQYARSVDGSDGDQWFSSWNAEPYVVFQNGVLDLTNPLWPELRPFHPKYKCTWAMNCEWDIVTHSADVDRYLETTLPDEGTRKALLQYLGYSIARFDTSEQRYALLYGAGRNGKGILMNVLETLFAGAFATTSMKDLTENRFTAYRLRDAAVNLVGDMSGERLQDTEILKRITGNDTIEAEQKFKDRFSFKPRVKLWFAVNELPSTPDVSYGFFRRLLVYPFTQRFTDERADPALARKIRSPGALSYLAYLAITEYGLMRNKGEGITESEEMKQAAKKYWSANDLVQMAIDDGIIEFGTDYSIPRALLHLAFEVYAEEWGRKPLGPAKLMERIRNANSSGEIAEKHLREGSKRMWVWQGVRLGDMGKQLAKRREFVDNETKQLSVAILPIEEFYRLSLKEQRK